MLDTGSDFATRYTTLVLKEHNSVVCASAIRRYGKAAEQVIGAILRSEALSTVAVRLGTHADSVYSSP